MLPRVNNDFFGEVFILKRLVGWQRDKVLGIWTEKDVLGKNGLIRECFKSVYVLEKQE